jgi:hypothetical protein
VRRFTFANLDEIIETNEDVSQRGAPRRDRFWGFRYHAGQARRLDLPDLLDANRAPVIEYFRRQGIRFREA